MLKPDCDGSIGVAELEFSAKDGVRYAQFVVQLEGEALEDLRVVATGSSATGEVDYEGALSDLLARALSLLNLGSGRSLIDCDVEVE